MPKGRSKTVGLDFGTSTSLVSQRTPGDEARVVPVGRSRSVLPSVARWSTEGWVVGEDALTYDDWMVRSVKRAITFHQAALYIGPPAAPMSVDPSTVVVEILRKIVERARSRSLDLSHEAALRLGCPAMWTGSQRNHIIDLAEGAGLRRDSISIIEEPVAAGLAWLNTLPANDEVAGRVLVFDMGGGTLDIAVLDVQPGQPRRIAVLTSIGVSVAGDNLDDALARRLESSLVGKVPTDNLAMGKAEIQRAANEAKHQLSTSAQTRVVFDRQAFGGPRIPTVTLQRDDLDAVFKTHMDAAEHKVWDALKLARLAHARGRGARAIFKLKPAALAADVDYLVLAGGMVNVPYVRQRLKEILPAAKIVGSTSYPPDEAIVAGLTDVSGADLINLYRPGFDFTLVDADTVIALYQAYTPLYEVRDLLGGIDEPSFAQRVLRHSVPRQRSAQVVVTRADGRPVKIIEQDKARNETIRDRLVIPIAHKDLEFRLYCDGRVIISDGKGHDHWLRVDAWPELIGADARPLPVDVPDPRVFHPFNKED